MGFAELTPRQLAPSVGTSGTGFTVSPAQSASANGSSPITITGPIPFGSFDYNPHSPRSTPANSDLQSGENVTVCPLSITANQTGTFVTAQPSTPASPSTGSAPVAPSSPAKSATSPASTPPRSPTLSEMMSLMATPASTPVPSPTPSEMESLMDLLHLQRHPRLLRLKITRLHQQKKPRQTTRWTSSPSTATAAANVRP